MPWKPFAVGSVIFAAVFVYLPRAQPSLWLGALDAAFISINVATAPDNAASMSDEKRDERSSAIEQEAGGP